MTLVDTSRPTVNCCHLWPQDLFHRCLRAAQYRLPARALDRTSRVVTRPPPTPSCCSRFRRRRNRPNTMTWSQSKTWIWIKTIEPVMNKMITTTLREVRSQDLSSYWITISFWVWICVLFVFRLIYFDFNCLLFHGMTAKPEIRLTPTSTNSSTLSSNQSYIQWQNKSIPPNCLFPNTFGSIRPQMWSYVPNNCTNSFANYSYSTSSGVLFKLLLFLFYLFFNTISLKLNKTNLRGKSLIVLCLSGVIYAASQRPRRPANGSVITQHVCAHFLAQLLL